jgi:teichuronic acid biosynthesis glycosyltransferase TuaC
VSQTVVVTTSYPEHHGDAQGHFVGAEVRQLCQQATVTVLAPGQARASLWGEQVVSLGGANAFGFPGALARLRERKLRAIDASRFVLSATRWLRQAPEPRRVIAHFLLPCGVPIATRGLRNRHCELEIVVHGSDARLLTRSRIAHRLAARELIRSGAELRFVSSELQHLLLDGLPTNDRETLARRSRIEPSPIDVDDVPSKDTARNRLGLERGAKLALVVARLVPSKRVQVALEACRRIPSLRALVLGDGPERRNLERRFPEVAFLGHVARPLALSYIAAADVLVSASLDEGAPTVVREARALGTPVVCLAAGDLREWAATDPGLSVVP